MRVARYYSNHDVRLEEQAQPVPGSGELLVRMEACGICASDAMEWYLRPRAPLVPGHEPVGVVVEVGEGVQAFAPGDRVFVHHHVPCMVCHDCRRGHYSLCPQFRQTRLDPGGLAEYFRVPAENVKADVLCLPEMLSFEAATFIEPVACCVAGLRRVGIQPGDTLAIVGAGVTGLIHLQLARLWGAVRVIVLDLVDYRLERAHELGADLVLNPVQGNAVEALHAANAGRGADAVLVCSSSLQAIELGLQLVGSGGTLELFAPTAPDVPLKLSPHTLFFNEITLTTSYSASPHDTRLALRYLIAKQIDVGRLITHRFSLAEVGEAIRLTAQANASLKVIVTRE